MININGRERFIEGALPRAQMIITDGGCGDLIAELVAADYNIRKAEGVIWAVFCPDYLAEFAKHVLPKKAWVISFSKADRHFKQDIPTFTTQWNSGHSPMRIHPVDYGFHMLCDRHPKEDERNYLQIRPCEIDVTGFDLPEKYICIAATAAVGCKALSGKIIDQVAAFAFERGYRAVFLGKKESKTGVKGLSVVSHDSGASLLHGIDLIDKTSLLQAAWIIHHSSAFVGMDGGLMHLAGCTDANIIAGFTIVSPEQVAPIRKNSHTYKFQAIEPDGSLPTRYYQSKTSVVTPGDFREFPRWKEVLESLTAEMFIDKLALYL